MTWLVEIDFGGLARTFSAQSSLAIGLAIGMYFPRQIISEIQEKKRISLSEMHVVNSKEFRELQAQVESFQAEAKAARALAEKCQIRMKELKTALVAFKRTKRKLVH